MSVITCTAPTTAGTLRRLKRVRDCGGESGQRRGGRGRGAALMMLGCRGRCIQSKFVNKQDDSEMLMSMCKLVLERGLQQR